MMNFTSKLAATAAALVAVPALAWAAPSPYSQTKGPPESGPYRAQCPDSEVDYIVRLLPNGRAHPNQNATGKCDEFNV
ncbi:hypothetical protein [Sphingomicrobium sediminis]|uniref:Uncharacterized protein n=1 Tax=Sphingomicrobium sediminis TaxID=2950949 RepID=A0A9X2EG83_9SPHN|nr:hypothetical protein [Sphingomicrobium sediminis]MCM8557445.1 hypothetical protein [Sphingomicrobium sediminis]